MKKMTLFNRIGFVLALLVAFVGAALPVLADTTSNMDNFYSGSLGSATVTGPSAYKGQSANFYTGGSLVWRAPQVNAQLASVQLPSLKAGCGGIDVFAGGFSFINSTQLIALGKAIVANAVGFAFNAALNFLSPQIHSIMEQLQKMANDVNQMNISSCMSSNQLQSSLQGIVADGTNFACLSGSILDGSASDQAAARNQCQTNAPSQAAAGGQSQNKNYAFNALNQISYLNSDQEFMGLVMNMVGTVIYECDDDGTKCSFDYRLPASTDAILPVFLYGGTYQGYQCDDFDVCLEPNDGHTFTIQTGFRDRVAASLQNIVTDVANRQPLAANEQNLIGSTSLPILRMIRVLVNADTSALAQADVEKFQDLLALQISTQFISQAITLSQQGASRDTSEAKDLREEWETNSNGALNALAVLETKLNTQLASQELILTRIDAIDKSLGSRAANRFAAASAYASAYSR